jgi:hypothetical protein
MRIFDRKREEVAGGWIRQDNGELHTSCTSTNIIRVIKSRRMRWAGYVAHKGHEKCTQNFDQKT